MVIGTKKPIEINSVEAFIAYIQQCYPDYSLYFRWDSTSLKEKINNFLKDTPTILDKKRVLIVFRQYMGMKETSLYMLSFWTKKGHSEEEAKKNICELQTKNALKFASARKICPEKYHASYTTRTEYWIKRGYNEEEAKKMVYERQSVGRLSKFIERYGEEEGNRRWQARQRKWIDSLHKNNNMDEVNKLKSCTKETFIARFGTEDGSKKYENMIDNMRLSHSLEGYQNKYGIIDGEIKYKEYIDAMKGRGTLKWHEEKYGKDVGFSKWKERCSKSARATTDRFSKISFDLFCNIIKECNLSGALYGKDECIIHLSINEINKINKVFLRPDFLYENKIIEFYGDVWHANPMVFNENDTPLPHNKELRSKDMWEIDKKRIDILKCRGYQVLIVWEKDYNDNKEKVLEICKNFIRGNNNGT